MKNIKNKIVTTEAIQYKGFMIYREGCKYYTPGNCLKFNSIDQIKFWIDMIDESNKKIQSIHNKQIIANETGNRFNIN